MIPVAGEGAEIIINDLLGFGRRRPWIVQGWQRAAKSL